ncbi:MAG: RidA family protein [Candidatus Binatia bacterium]
MKRRVHSPQAPAPIGPYSQAVESDRLLFSSGQIALDPVSGEFVGGDAGAQCRRVMENLAAVLGAAGLGFDDVVKTTIYLTDLADFVAVNEVYGSFFREPFPARSTVGVAGLPKGARVEIDVIARRG